MSIYDQRNSPAYSGGYYKYRNPMFDQWWTTDHDHLILQLIEEYQWDWNCAFHTRVEALTPNEVMKNSCDLDGGMQGVWYNKVVRYAQTRADDMGITNRIRKPARKLCPLCNEHFTEDSLPFPLVKRLGIDRLDFCAPCLKEIVLQQTGNNDSSKDDICAFITQLVSITGIIPPQGYGEGMDDLIDLDDETRLEVLNLLRSKPSVSRVRAVFGSWLKALIAAGVLANGTRETARGIQTIALDGHTCFSLGEKAIDDYLYKQGIAHDREPKYPEGNYRGDFLVGDVIIEYFGLAGDPTYDAKIKEKIRLCKLHGITLIGIYPKDLVTTTKLAKKLEKLKW